MISAWPWRSASGWIELISPASVIDSGLDAPRSPKLTLRASKLAGVIGRPIPNPPPVWMAYSRFINRIIHRNSGKCRSNLFWFPRSAWGTRGERRLGYSDNLLT